MKIFIVFDKFNMTGLNLGTHDLFGGCLLNGIIKRFRQYETWDDPKQWETKDIIRGVFATKEKAEALIENLYSEAEDNGADIDGFEDWYFVREYEVDNEPH